MDFIDLKSQYRALRGDINARIQAVLTLEVDEIHGTPLIGERAATRFDDQWHQQQSQ